MSYEVRARFYAGPWDGHTATMTGDETPPLVVHAHGTSDGVYWQSREDRSVYEWEQWDSCDLDLDEVDDVDDRPDVPPIADVIQLLAERARVERSEWAQRIVDECRRDHPSAWQPDGDQ